MTTPLGSRYELVEKIATGATGAVWRARVLATGEAVAAKQIRAELATDADVVDRFLRERRVLTSITHPAVVRVRDLVVEGDQISLVMDLVDGADLRHSLAVAGALAPTSAVLIAATIADALAAAHAAGIVHADVKPANVLVPADGGPVRLADFGVSRLVHGPAPLSYGTPEYIAPEVVQGHASIPPSDVYGLGIVLYELLTGTTPYRGGSSAEVMKRHVSARPIWTDAVPEVVRPVLTACLVRDPARRPTAETLAADLRAVAPELAGTAAATPLPEGTPHFRVVPVVESVTGGVEPDERVTSVLPAKPVVRPNPTLALPAPEPAMAAAAPMSASGTRPGEAFAMVGPSDSNLSGSPSQGGTPGWDSPGAGSPGAAPWGAPAAPGPSPAAPSPAAPSPAAPTSGGPAPTNVYPAAAPGGAPPPSFDDTLSPPRWAFPAGTIPPRPPKKKRWPLVLGLVVLVLVVLGVVGGALAVSGVLSSSDEAETTTPSTAPSQQVSSAPSPSATGTPAGPDATPAQPGANSPTGVPDLPLPGETMTPPDQPMQTMPSDGGQIGQPIN